MSRILDYIAKYNENLTIAQLKEVIELEQVEIKETFDKEILFDALDIEVEKVWNGSELEVRFPHSDWEEACLNLEYRLKPKNKELDLLKEQAKELGYKIIKI